MTDMLETYVQKYGDKLGATMYLMSKMIQTTSSTDPERVTKLLTLMGTPEADAKELAEHAAAEWEKIYTT